MKQKGWRVAKEVDCRVYKESKIYVLSLRRHEIITVALNGEIAECPAQPIRLVGTIESSTGIRRDRPCTACHTERNVCPTCVLLRHLPTVPLHQKQQG